MNNIGSEDYYGENEQNDETFNTCGTENAGNTGTEENSEYRADEQYAGYSSANYLGEQYLNSGSARYVGEAPTPEKKQKRASRRWPIAATICMCALALLFAATAIYAGRLSNRVAAMEAKLALSQGQTQQQTVSKSENNTENSAQNGNSSAPADGISYTHGTVPTGDEYSMIQNCMESVVSIDIMTQSGYGSVTSGSGSGVIISEDGYIVTCNHVVEDADKIYVYLNDGTSYEASLIGRDILNDIAVIKIEATNLTFARFGDSDSLRVGEGVFAIGNALGQLSNTYTEGCISALDRQITVEGQDMTLLQTDAAVNHGNSGGGLFRASDGTLIGIVNAKSDGSGIEGLGFAIPSVDAVRIVNDLMNYGFVTGRPYLGVATRDITLSGYGFFSSYYTYPKVTSVESGSPADIAGIKEGDIILAINGNSISGASGLVKELNACSIGDEITVTVLRDRQNVDITVTLGERPVDSNQ